MTAANFFDPDNRGLALTKPWGPRLQLGPAPIRNFDPNPGPGRGKDLLTLLPMGICPRQIFLTPTPNWV